MTILHQYHYRKGKVAFNTVTNILLSLALVGFEVYAYVNWGFGFLFDDWKGYVVFIFYVVMTLGALISSCEGIVKLSKSRKDIPALVIATDRFVVYDRNGLSTEIRFDDCTSLKVKHGSYSRHSDPTYVCVIRHTDRVMHSETESVDIELDELDDAQEEIEKAIWSAYNAHKRNNSNYEL